MLSLMKVSAAFLVARASAQYYGGHSHMDLSPGPIHHAAAVHHIAPLAPGPILHPVVHDHHLVLPHAIHNGAPLDLMMIYQNNPWVLGVATLAVGVIATCVFTQKLAHQGRMLALVFACILVCIALALVLDHNDGAIFSLWCVIVGIMATCIITRKSAPEAFGWVFAAAVVAVAVSLFFGGYAGFRFHLAHSSPTNLTMSTCLLALAAVVVGTCIVTTVQKEVFAFIAAAALILLALGLHHSHSGQWFGWGHAPMLVIIMCLVALAVGVMGTCCLSWWRRREEERKEMARLRAFVHMGYTREILTKGVVLEDDYFTRQDPNKTLDVQITVGGNGGITYKITNTSWWDVPFSVPAGALLAPVNPEFPRVLPVIIQQHDLPQTTVKGNDTINIGPVTGWFGQQSVCKKAGVPNGQQYELQPFVWQNSASLYAQANVFQISDHYDIGRAVSP